jgi:uncharacterized protein involved in exopolysaccharide biosynthesis
MANHLHFRKVAAGILAALGALTLAAGIYLLRTPPMYEAVTRVKAEKEYPDTQPLPPTRPGFDPYWVQTEFEAIQSKVVLFAVISNLNLTSRWSATTNALTLHHVHYLLLKDRLDVRQARNSSLIEIRARSHDPKEAAELANAVATAYREYRLQQRQITSPSPELLASPVEILDFAEPPRRPSRPNHKVGLLLVIAACLSELLALVVFTRRKV